MIKSHIECNDYDVGDFSPISFTPKLKWKIIQSKFIDHPTTRLPKSIWFQAKLFGCNFNVYSHPYSYGKFSAECRTIGFGGKSYWLDTHDPEEAIYLAEMYLLNWAQIRKEHYSKIVRKLNNQCQNKKL